MPSHRGGESLASKSSHGDHRKLEELKKALVVQECGSRIKEIDALLDRKSLQMKVKPGSNQQKTRDYSLLKAHSDPEIRLHYLTIYADCLNRLLGRGSHPYDPKNKRARRPRWVLLADGLGTIELMAWSSCFSPQVTVESPSFMVYMSVLHDLSKEPDHEAVDDASSHSEVSNGEATSTTVQSARMVSSGVPFQENIVKEDPTRHRFETLDNLIMDYDRGNRNGADGFEHEDWGEVMDRFTQIPEYITADCCSDGEAKTVLSRSSRWAIATLEKPFWEALLSLNPSGALSSDSRAQSIVLSHLDSRWPETVGFKNPSLFPASKDSHAFINR